MKPRYATHLHSHFELPACQHLSASLKLKKAGWLFRFLPDGQYLPLSIPLRLNPLKLKFASLKFVSCKQNLRLCCSACQVHHLFWFLELASIALFKIPTLVSWASMKFPILSLNTKYRFEKFLIAYSSSYYLPLLLAFIVSATPSLFMIFHDTLTPIDKPHQLEARK